MDNNLIKGDNFRKKLLSKFFIYGMILKNDAFTSLENEFLNGYPPYNNLDEFLKLILDILINKLPTDNPLIDKDFAELIIKRLHSLRKEEPVISHDLVIRNVNCSESSLNTRDAHQLHIKFLRSLCNKFVEHIGDTNNSFEIKELSSIINTYRATMHCNVFGFLRRNLSKINEYILEDESGSVVVEFNENTERRNAIILENSFVLIDGTFHSLANALFVNKIGYLPSKLSLELNEEENDENRQRVQSNLQSNMFIIIKDVFLDERVILEKLKILFTAYNGVSPLPHFFIFIGPFTRNEIDPKRFKALFQFFFRIILTCPNISHHSKIIIVPGVDENDCQDKSFIKPPLFNKEDFQLNNLDVNFTSNPCNLYVNDRHICIFSSNYFKSIKKHILFRRKTSDEDFYNEFCNIILSNSYLTPGLSKNFNNPFNLFHLPDLLIFADDSIASKEISFKLTNRVWTINLRSFSKEDFKFCCYYSDTNVIENSQMNF